MKTEVHEIDLAKARDFIGKNTFYERGQDETNRPLNLRKINQYALDMLRGDWKLTHQGIAFDKKGALKDGQHRLLAIIQAAEEGAMDGETKVPAKPRIKIQMAVTFGLDNNTFDTIDTGYTRNAGQVLAIAGYTNQLGLAASAKLLHLFDHHEFKYWRETKVTNHEILHVVRETGIDEYIPSIRPLIPLGFIVAASTVGYYVCNRAYPEGPHEEFLSGLNTGEGLGKEDPRLVLRNYVIRSKGLARIRRDSYVHLALWIIAWNDFVNGKKRSQISWRTTQDFPRPIEK